MSSSSKSSKSNSSSSSTTTKTGPASGQSLYLLDSISNYGSVSGSAATLVEKSEAKGADKGGAP